MCNFEECQVCSCKGCWTGQIAREKGLEAYNEHLEMLDKAEELLE